MSFKCVIDRGKTFFYNEPRNSVAWNFASCLVIALTSLTGKVFVTKWNNAEILHESRLHEAFEQSRLTGRGLITVMNHISILDDPLVWSILPVSTLCRPKKMRWTLGAQDICFTNLLTNLYFSLGQVLATKRFGAGPFQDSIDAAIMLLSRAAGFKYENVLQPTPPLSKDLQWVHIYPEGFVHQPLEPFVGTLRYFKWGVSRLVLEASYPPIVLPIFAKGLDSVFPEDRQYFSTWKTFSRRTLYYNIGTPLSDDLVLGFRERWIELSKNFEKSQYVPLELQIGEPAQQLRSEVALCLRSLLFEAGKDLHFTMDLPCLADASCWKKDAPIPLRTSRPKHSV